LAIGACCACESEENLNPFDRIKAVPARGLAGYIARPIPGCHCSFVSSDLPREEPPKRLNRVQILRFFAATAVVLFHSVAVAESRGLSPDVAPWAVYGAQGVDLFFVISGCIIYYTVEVAGLTGGIFLRRRLERLLPLYWAFTLLVFAIGTLLPGMFASGGAARWMTVPNLISSLLFVSLPTRHQTVIFVGWTLEFEMLFYITTTLLLIISKQPWTFVGVGLGAAVFMGRVAMPASPLLHFLTSPLMLEFLMGMVIAERLIKRRFNLALIVPLAIGLAASLPTFRDVWRIFLAGIPAAILVFALVRADLMVPIGKSAPTRTLMLLGDASYSIYLIQVLSVPATFRLVLAVFPAFSLIALIFVAAITTLVAGLFSFVAFERPLMRFFRSRRKRRQDQLLPVRLELANPP
jgi:exopolysaccharide production protein ExoZ